MKMTSGNQDFAQFQVKVPIDGEFGRADWLRKARVIRDELRTSLHCPGLEVVDPWRPLPRLSRAAHSPSNPAGPWGVVA
jgi:hypothetical protein